MVLYKLNTQDTNNDLGSRVCNCNKCKYGSIKWQKYHKCELCCDSTDEDDEGRRRCEFMNEWFQYVDYYIDNL